MGLITVANLEKAMGTTFSNAEADQAQYYIDTVSAYVETYTGVAFSLHEDETIRVQADYYGQIVLELLPIADITIVDDASQVTPKPVFAQALIDWGFDGYNTIYNLQPHAVYNVTLTYGYDTVPTDIQGYVTEMCRQAMNNPEGLSQYRVGDVTETYNTKTEVDRVLSLGGLGQKVLDAYKVTESSWRLGPREYIRRIFPDM